MHACMRQLAPALHAPGAASGRGKVLWHGTAGCVRLSPPPAACSGQPLIRMRSAPLARVRASHACVTCMCAQVKDALLKNVRRRMTPQPVKVRADVELTCFNYDGIEHIKTAIRAAEALSTEDVPVKMKLVAPPLYVLTTQTLDKAKGVEILNQGEREGGGGGDEGDGQREAGAADGARLFKRHHRACARHACMHSGSPVKSKGRTAALHAKGVSTACRSQAQPTVH